MPVVGGRPMMAVEFDDQEGCTEWFAGKSGLSGDGWACVMVKGMLAPG